MPNSSISIAQYYHERTKYSPEILQQGSEIDWDKQPVPFKEYPIGVAFDLKPYLQESTIADYLHDPNELFWYRLSRLFVCSYGLTGMIPNNGEPYYLRAAPSAGGLYPAEMYLISRGTPQLPAGLYNYQAKTHSLLHFWESELWTALQSACFWHPALEGTQLALVITDVFYRSAWRYQDRAYRRICLDTGHLLGNLELAGSVTDFRPHLIGGFADQAMNDLLYLAPEQEGTMAVVALADRRLVNQNLPLSKTALPSHTQADYPRKMPNGLLLRYLHQATEIEMSEAKVDWKIPTAETDRVDKYNFPFCLKVPMATTPILWGPELTGLEDTLLNRRSTRDYSGEPITLTDLQAILSFTYQPQQYIDQQLDRSPDYFDLNLVETFIAVSGVTGLEEGCYYYAPKAQELRQIRFKNFRQELHYLCLGQTLGRDAAAVIFHTADLSAAIEQYGDRAYRYLHLDAGHLGQRLNLAAIRLGLGVSGIGGFFDDQVNEVLGIPADEAVLYITTLGQPWQNPRTQQP
ncbi:MAG: SagB-type dehydrogenase domain-containing protein [Alkalinema sp. CACIAM 70d]|nr:MAG: SagB-type dehydrogenase domain-containing protein [Alkalinema sp. CACIAM 70d]